MSVLSYSAAGVVSSTLIGLLLGWIGKLLLCRPPIDRRFYLLFVGVFSLALAAREVGWIEFSLLERKRQTEGSWVHQFGFVTASAMWGFHIGLGFATHVTFGGFWILVAVAVAGGDPIRGAMLMLFYWLGRIIPVWCAPVLLPANSDPQCLLEVVVANRFTCHHVTSLALIWCSAMTVVDGFGGFATVFHPATIGH
jgi:cytochrome c biogenesis protein CcdA